MFWWIAQLLLSSVSGLKSYYGTYMWDISEKPSGFGLMDYPSSSFIVLHHYDEKVRIHQVKRGMKWIGGSFCSRMLPAVLRDFLSQIQAPLIAIEVFNMADPVMAGCRCYTRAMREMGFTKINDQDINSDICKLNDGMRGLMTASDRNEQLQVNNSSEEQILILNQVSHKKIDIYQY